jgi:hypothetical protein
VIHGLKRVLPNPPRAILRSHLIEPSVLRSDDFEEFYALRRRALLSIIERAMGKPSVTQERELPAVDDEEEDEGEDA